MKLTDKLIEALLNKAIGATAGSITAKIPIGDGRVADIFIENVQITVGKDSQDVLLSESLRYMESRGTK